MKLVETEEAKAAMIKTCSYYGCSMLSVEEICQILDSLAEAGESAETGSKGGNGNV